MRLFRRKPEPVLIEQKWHRPLRTDAPLPAFGSIRPCPKCRSGSREISYRSRYLTYLCELGKCPQREHIHVACKVCGYGWLEETADSPAAQEAPEPGDER